MKKPEETPPDAGERNRQARKAFYDKDHDGRVTKHPDPRSAMEMLVTEQAVHEFERLARESLDQVQRGECSTLQYHMYRMRMDPATLAQATGLWRWRVKRHLRDQGCLNRLPARTLKRYADALATNTQMILHIPGEEKR